MGQDSNLRTDLLNDTEELRGWTNVFKLPMENLSKLEKYNQSKKKIPFPYKSYDLVISQFMLAQAPTFKSRYMHSLTRWRRIM